MLNNIKEKEVKMKYNKKYLITIISAIIIIGLAVAIGIHVGKVKLELASSEPIFVVQPDVGTNVIYPNDYLVKSFIVKNLANSTETISLEWNETENFNNVTYNISMPYSLNLSARSDTSINITFKINSDSTVGAFNRNIEIYRI